MATVNEVTAAADAYDNQTALEKAQAKAAGTTTGTTTTGTDYSTYQPTTLQAATSQADSINNYYDQYIASQKQAEEDAYNSNIAAIDYQVSKVAPAYKQQREALASEKAIADKNFRETAAASGINTGTGSQYALSSQNAYQTNMTSLRKAEAQALADIEETRRQTTADYQAKVAEAISNGELARAQALYDEAVRVDESLVATAQAQATENYNAWYSQYQQSRAQADDAYNTWYQQYQEDRAAADDAYNAWYQTFSQDNETYEQKLTKAQTLASYGDFSGYLDLGYTSSQVAAMKALWNAQNTSSSSGSSGSSSGSSSNSNYTSNYTPSSKTNNTTTTTKSSGTGLIKTNLNSSTKSGTISSGSLLTAGNVSTIGKSKSTTSSTGTTTSSTGISLLPGSTGISLLPGGNVFLTSKKS